MGIDALLGAAKFSRIGGVRARTKRERDESEGVEERIDSGYWDSKVEDVGEHDYPEPQGRNLEHRGATSFLGTAKQSSNETLSAIGEIDPPISGSPSVPSTKKEFL